jgi:hypothetical protein
MEYLRRAALPWPPDSTRSVRFIVAILTACAMILMIFGGVYIHDAFAVTRG